MASRADAQIVAIVLVVAAELDAAMALIGASAAFPAVAAEPFLAVASGAFLAIPAEIFPANAAGASLAEAA